MQVINANDVKVYNVTAHKSLPEVSNFITRVREYNGEWARLIELRRTLCLGCCWRAKCCSRVDLYCLKDIF